MNPNTHIQTKSKPEKDRGRQRKTVKNSERQRRTDKDRVRQKE